jgi:hypothetical protein
MMMLIMIIEPITPAMISMMSSDNELSPRVDEVDVEVEPATEPLVFVGPPRDVTAAARLATRLLAAQSLFLLPLRMVVL